MSNSWLKKVNDILGKEIHTWPKLCKNSIQCPACSSTNIKKSSVIQEIEIPFADECLCNISIYTCTNCGEFGDFSGQNDQIIKSAMVLAEEKSINNMLDLLKNKNILPTYINRALGLDMKTIDYSKYSPIMVVLLQIIVTFPWLLEVAGSGFDPLVIKKFTIKNYE
jgi:hypothetical protein